ncbi:MAG: hypothetical protein QW520_03860, partial [Methanomassiliicoccales archaeon]
MLENTFIEPELKELKKQFSRIVLIPSSIGGPYFEPPIDCEVELSLARILNNNKYIKYLKYFLIAIINKYFYKELINNISIIDINILYKMVDYVASASIVEKWLPDLIRKRDLNLKKTIFYTYWFSKQTLGLILFKIRNNYVTVVTRAHGGDLFCDRHFKNYIPFRKLSIDIIDNIFTISEAGKKHLISNYKISNPEKIKVARLGVPRSNKLAKKSTDGVIRIVSCSYLHPIKRLNLLIDGIHRLSRLQPNVKIEWTHFGGGHFYNEIYNYALEKLNNNVIFDIKGSVPNDLIINHYETYPVDLFINT